MAPYVSSNFSSEYPTNNIHRKEGFMDLVLEESLGLVFFGIVQDIGTLNVLQCLVPQETLNVS